MNEIAEYINISTSPLVNASLYIVFFIIVAKIADLLVNKVLRKFTRFTKSDVDDRIIDLIHNPIFFSIILIGFTFTVQYLAPSEKAVFYTSSTMNSILTIIWCVTAIRISNTIIEHAVFKVSDVTGLSRDIVPLVENVSKIIIIIASIMVVLSLWNINITPLLASAGIVGVAVALAAKDTIANFFGGISVFMDKPFSIGDYIVLDQGERGEVVAIGVRSTRIRTRDDVQITVPNSILANTKIINESAPVPNFRVRIPVSVAYGSDIDMVQNTLIEIVKGNGNVLPGPSPRVRFRTFGESSLNFELLCWAKDPSLRGFMVHELNCAIYKRFNEAGIKIPFPQRDVHIHSK